MRTCNAGTIGLLAAVAVLAGAATSKAQTIIEGQTALENARSVATRAPGRMVDAGLGRLQAFTAATAAGVTITEQPRGTSARAQALATAITTVFDQLNTTIVLFQNLLLARAGSPPVIPTGLLPPTFGDSSSGGQASGSPDGVLGSLDLGGLDLGDLGDLGDQSGAPGSKASERD